MEFYQGLVEIEAKRYWKKGLRITAVKMMKLGHPDKDARWRRDRVRALCEGEEV